MSAFFDQDDEAETAAEITREHYPWLYAAIIEMLHQRLDPGQIRGRLLTLCDRPALVQLGLSTARHLRYTLPRSRPGLRPIFGEPVILPMPRTRPKVRLGIVTAADG